MRFATSLGGNTYAMRLRATWETYRRAELRLRHLLFGDGSDSPGRLKGEEPRRQVATELRRMRTAFDEAIEASDTSPALAEDLLDVAKDAPERRAPGERPSR